MIRTPINKDDQCYFIEHYTVLTNGSYQKRCPNGINFLLYVPGEKQPLRACHTHTEKYLHDSENSENIRLTRVLTDEEWDEMIAKEDQEQRLVELHTMPYREYLQTFEWKERRLRILKRDGYRCQVCNSPNHLNVHHRDYTRRGHELDTDLVTLCQGCHQVFHENSRLVRVEA